VKLLHPRKNPVPLAEPRTPGAILEVSDLEVDFSGGQGPRAVQGLSLALLPGRVVGVAGESGSGKSVSALSMIGLLPRTAHVEGSIRYRGEELIGTSERRWRDLRGRDIAMVFQETVSALNPVVPVGKQMNLAARNATGGDKGVADRIRAALREVGLTDVDRVLRSYPHELSGGMCQRVVIAMALSCGSKVLLADEPTTALDVCVQQEVLALLQSVVANHGMAVVLISHDLGVLAQLCDELIVMYQGQVMEQGPADAILRGPASPYTAALLRSLPRVDGQQVGSPSSALVGGAAAGPGCPYSARCPWATEACGANPPLGDFDDGDADHRRLVRCWHAADVHHSGAGIAR
jgi:peptide/nickel transport system ATP-binding protein